MSSSPRNRPRIPLVIKLLYTLWVIVLIPVWIRVQGLQNFLWLSDIGLLGTCVAIWLESRLLSSMMALAVVLPDLGWTLLFMGRMLIDAEPFAQTGYMFNEQIPLFVRGLSLYHIFVPPLLVWMVYRLGYDLRALPAQILLTAIVLLLTRAVTDPADNINFVFGFGEPPRPPVPQPLWFVGQMVVLLVGAHLPMHLLLRRWRSA